MNILQIFLLGQFRLIYDGRVVDRVNTPRMQSLLTYLAIHPGVPMFRYHLAYTFWPDSSESQALTNLRNLFHRLRKVLPEADRLIKVDAQSLQWIPGPYYRTDVQEFERLLANRTTLREAIDLYGGDLLPECYDDWIQPERERLRRLFRENCLALADALELERDYSTALSYLDRLSASEPLDEAVFRRQMRLHALMGNRTLAIAAYQSFEQKVLDEYGIEPGEATRNLYQSIYQADTAAVDVRKGKIPLVGRSIEWEKTLLLWDYTAGGGAQLLLLSGEPGIGKTRFAEEVVEWAARQGIVTASAACYPGAASIPYAPIATWLNMLPLPDLIPADLAELSRFLPDLLAHVPDLHATRPIIEPRQGQRLSESLARAILGDGTPRILWMDDIQWCDADTIAWLKFFLHFASRSPLLLLCGIPSDTTEWQPYLHDFIDQNRKEGRCSILRIGPLDEEQTTKMASLVNGSQFSSIHSENLYRQTEGNPLFIIEFMLSRQEAHGDQTTPMAFEWALPGKVHTILERRFSQLSPAAYDLACLAAIFGRQFRFEHLEAASYLGSDKFAKAVDELLTRQIIRERESLYEFTHGKLRETALVSMKTARKRLLHRRVADWLAKEDPPYANPWNAEIAYHYDEAGLPTKAIDYYLLAAKDLREAFSTQEALRNLLRAVDLATSPGLFNKQVDLAHLFEALGDVYVSLGKPVEARQALLNAFSAAHSNDTVLLAGLYRKLSTTYEIQQRFEDAHAALDQAESLFCRIEIPSVSSHHTDIEKAAWLKTQYARAYLFYWQGNISEIDRIIEIIRCLVENRENPIERLDLLDLQVLSAMQKEKISLSPQTLAIVRQKYQLSLSVGSRSKVAFSQFQYGFALLWQGHVHLAIQELEEALGRGVILDDFLLMVRCRVYLSLAYRMLHDITKVREITLKLLDATNKFENPVTLIYHEMILGNMAWLAWKDGDLDSAVQYGMKAFVMRNKSQALPPLQWSACFPLLAAALDMHDLDLECRAAKAILSPEQQPMPEAIAFLLSEGVKAAMASIKSESERVFSQAVEVAIQHGYL